ncbi:MAG TPA: AAA family ATPase, partial [Spirillospora sp.]
MTHDPAPADPEILAERAYLRMCREALRAMRDAVLTTETVQGDAFVDKYNNAIIREARAQRAEQLLDLPDVPLFFGRLDYPPGEFEELGYDGAGPGRRGDDEGPRDTLMYIGRRAVRDVGGTPLVVDWRAPVGRAFYQAGPRNPMRVRRRRRYGFDAGGELTAYEDEIIEGTRADGPRGPSALLTAELERPRSGPMRDIVATIQPEQDDIVRAPLDRTVCVQGAPGTGKTAVGLHRLAYLLYTDRERLKRGGTVIIGPNRSFLAYIRNVLPALGEVGVTQTTVEEFLDSGGVEVRREDDPEAARIKGDARMAEVIRRDLWSRVRPPEEDLVAEVGGRRWRLDRDEVAEILRECRDSDVSYNAGRELLTQRIATAVIRLMERSGKIGDGRTRGTVRRSSAIKTAVAEMWPRAEAAKLVLGLLTDRERLARAADGLLDPEEQEAVLLPGKPRSVKSARWSPADLALIDEASNLLDRQSGLAHVVVDEAQDLSPMLCRAIARRSAGSCTVLGDLAQATSPAAPGDWETLLSHLGKPGGEIVELDRGYRVPAQILDYAARLLPRIAPGLRSPASARQSVDALQVT